MLLQGKILAITFFFLCQLLLGILTAGIVSDQLIWGPSNLRVCSLWADGQGVNYSISTCNYIIGVGTISVFATFVAGVVNIRSSYYETDKSRGYVRGILIFTAIYCMLLLAACIDYSAGLAKTCANYPSESCSSFFAQFATIDTAGHVTNYGRNFTTIKAGEGSCWLLLITWIASGIKEYLSWRSGYSSAPYI